MQAYLSSIQYKENLTPVGVLPIHLKMTEIRLIRGCSVFECQSGGALHWELKEPYGDFQKSHTNVLIQPVQLHFISRFISEGIGGGSNPSVGIISSISLLNKGLSLEIFI